MKIGNARREYTCSWCDSKILEGEEVTFLLAGYNYQLPYHPGCRQQKLNQDRYARVKPEGRPWIWT